MEKIKFSIDVYYDTDEIIKEPTNITQNVFDRMAANDCHDLYDGIEAIGDEDVFDIIEDFIKKSTIEELKLFISVDEGSIRFDKSESYECDYELLAYIVDVTLDVEKILMAMKE